MPTLRIFLPLLCALLIFGCKESPSVAPQEAFEFKTLTDAYLPLADVRVSFSKEGASFVGRTNVAGIVQVPVRFRGGRAALSKSDFQPAAFVHGLVDSAVLFRTPKRLRAIGSVEGTAVRFGNGSLITFDYRGVYRAYVYGQETVAKTLETRFSDTVIAINRYTASGDTLWFTTRDTAIYAISLVDPALPTVLHQFRLPAMSGPIAVRDSLIILGEEQLPAAARVLTFGPSGLQQVSSIQYFYPKQLCVIGSYAVFFDGDPFYAAFDLSNPAVPLLVHLNSSPGFSSAMRLGTRLLLGPPEVGAYGSPLLMYTSWEISNPGAPQSQTTFSDSYITAVGNGTTMIGTWQHDPGLMTVVEGTFGGTYHTVACRSWSTMPATDGAAPPYFLFGGMLWMLETVTGTF